MATNDFLVVAPGPAPNIATQATYAADPAVTTGNLSGVAKSAIINKSLRQATVMAATLAQFIVDMTGQNAVDDGTIATLLANLKIATKGRIIDIQVFTSLATYVAANGVTSVIAMAVGGGGGGGGVPATNASQQATAAGGICGGYIKALITSGFNGALITPGNAGAIGGPSTPGGNGSSTTFGSFLTAPGGAGGAQGSATGATATIFPSSVSGTDPTSTGLILESIRGSSGNGASVLSLSQVIGGTGGDSVWGRGGRPVTGQAGNAGTGFGSGGSGASGVPSQGGANGGAGTPGRLVVIGLS